MNPVFLLLGMLGAGAIGLGGSKKDKSDRKEKEEDTTQNEADTTPSDETTPDSPVEDDTSAEDTTAQQPEPEPDPVVQDPTPDAPDQSGDGGSGADTTPTPTNEGTVEVMAGRVATLEAINDVADVRILSGVEHGTVTVNPDNTFALVMTQSDFIGTQSFTYEATHANGSVTTHEVTLDVTPGVAENGWGTGEYQYMLETDENNHVIVEHGDNHQTVYVTGSDSALGLADIAALEGLSVSQITDTWLANSDYGRTEGTALDVEAGMMLWREITPSGSQTSNWLLFEKGYSYYQDGWGAYDRFIPWGAEGESELHPIYVGAWGEGDRPILEEGISGFGDSFTNVVFQGLELQAGMTLLDAENVILDDMVFTDDQLNMQGGEGLTVMNSSFYDIYTSHEEADSIVDGYWTSGDFTQGAFIANIDGFLLENSFFDHNGWEDDYHLDGSADGGQPPLMFNQNIYIQDNNVDVTVRDSIFMRGSLNGLMVRSGGYLEDNVMIANNAAGAFYDYSYTLFTDNLVTDAGGKQAPNIGYETAGMDGIESNMASLVDNIIAHITDPNDPDDLNRSDYAYRVTNPYYDDTIVWNWEYSDANIVMGADDQNVDGLDTSVLDQTTIQNFTAQLLGQDNATMEDLAEYLRAQADGAFDDIVDADLIIKFFQDGFGISPDIRLEAGTLRFIPNDLSEGVRWDNRLNWDTEDLPGLYGADSVDLGGNDVVFGMNTTIDTLDFNNGSLNVYGGKLTLTGGITGDGTGNLNIEGAGQLWTEGSDADDTDITVQGGRFVNTGEMTNTDLTVTGGQTVLATGGAEFDLGASRTLAVFDAAAKVGFDGDDGGIAILDMHEDATLAYQADGGDLGTIEEFRSGAFGDETDVQSGIDLGDAILSIDLAGLSAADGAAFTLMDADEIVGLFSDATVEGLSGQNARIVIDYETDSVTLELSSGNGVVTIDTIGVETDVTAGEESLWDALTADHGVASETQQSFVDEEDDALLTAA